MRKEQLHQIFPVILPEDVSIPKSVDKYNRQKIATITVPPLADTVLWMPASSDNRRYVQLKARFKTTPWRSTG